MDLSSVLNTVEAARCSEGDKKFGQQAERKVTGIEREIKDIERGKEKRV